MEEILYVVVCFLLYNIEENGKIKLIKKYLKIF